MPIITQENLAEIEAMNAPSVDGTHGGTPSARGGLSEAQLRDARSEWIKAGLDVEKFDAGMKADGLELPAIDASDHHADYALAYDPQPSDYKVEWPREFMAEKTPEQRSTLQKAAGEFGAAMGFQPSLGAYLIEHIAEIGPKLAKMSPDDRKLWSDQQERVGIHSAGSEEAYKARLESAKAIVAKLAAHTELGKALVASGVLSDVWVMSTLANHSRAVEAFAKEHPAEKTK